MFDQSNFYSEGLPEDRSNLLNLVVGAYRSIRSDVSYVSMPITSGKLMYDVLERKGVKTLEELGTADPTSIVEDIIRPNIEMGIVAADNLKSSFPALAPSVFEGKSFRWTQEEYMTLWLQVIKERAREMHMTDGWEYSNGGVEEFTLAQQMKLRCVGIIDKSQKLGCAGKEYRLLTEDMARMQVYGLDKKEISLDAGIDIIKGAIEDLDKRGFESSRLTNSLDSLKLAWTLTSAPFIPEEDALYYQNGFFLFPPEE
ncbi:DUF4406 domain-containing protein [Methanococcoides sp. SA1]|nr:DUF4406 domain-containing protein [Methanococcoides sp. SA1]